VPIKTILVESRIVSSRDIKGGGRGEGREGREGRGKKLDAFTLLPDLRNYER
jgi:hypothetical protein